MTNMFAGTAIVSTSAASKAFLKIAPSPEVVGFTYPITNRMARID
jgi:hypothetical protein